MPPFLVLEPLGLSAAESLPPDDGFEFLETLRVMRDVAAALEDIHALGDAHLDVKPENILQDVAKDGWKLIDPGDADLNTNEYSSRHLRGWRQDIFALGRTFITLHTGGIDEALQDFQREWLLDLSGGSAFVRLLDRMLEARPSEGSRSHPSASKVQQQVDKMLRLNELGDADVAGV